MYTNNDVTIMNFWERRKAIKFKNMLQKRGFELSSENPKNFSNLVSFMANCLVVANVGFTEYPPEIKGSYRKLAELGSKEEGIFLRIKTEDPSRYFALVSEVATFPETYKNISGSLKEDVLAYQESAKKTASLVSDVDVTVF